MVLPQAARSFEARAHPVATNACLEGLGHVPASPTRPGIRVGFLHKLAGQDQVCAHSHAHKYAHRPMGVKSMGTGLATG
jgi:hypothetical protein